MKKLIFVMWINLFGLSFVVTADDGVYKKSIANIGEDLMVIPCVEVEASIFDGYYHVLMEATGDKSGFDWRVKEFTLASEANCEGDSTEDNSMQDVLNATGLGLGTDGTDGTNSTDDTDEPVEDSDNPDEIEESIDDIDSPDDIDALIDDGDSSDDLDDDMDDPNEDLGDDSNDEGSSYSY